MAAPTFSAAGLDGPSTWPIAVRATDDDGLTGATVTGSVAITNVNPTLDITGPATTSPASRRPTRSRPPTFRRPIKQGSSDYVIDWGDGTSDTFLNESAVFTAEHAYDAVGSYEISATTRDKDNGTSAADTLDIVVSPISVVDGALVISGTSGNDRIVLSPGIGGVSIRYNGKIAPVPVVSPQRL